MNKIIRTLSTVFLILGLLLTVPFAASAQELRIGTTEELLEFSENCRLDQYSVGLTVYLDADLDLTDTAFTGIPTFAGIFEGNGHRIIGLKPQISGSYQGFFRYLQKGAVLRNLHIEGTLSPGGSRSIVGGLAGSNSGTIENCTFKGQVTGTEKIGGITGTNEIGGLISGCKVEGNVHGTHFIGGIAGENLGVIRSSSNTAAINDTPAQNSVDISDVTLESITDSESVSTVTDIGGIVGFSTGVVRDCNNNGTVGYRQIGYNIGGIAGRQAGYITGCTNEGAVYGRKEIGGIVGQMEPVIQLDYDEDTLQTLQGQLTALEQLTDQAVNNSQNSADLFNQQAALLQDPIQQAQQATDLLLPDRDQPALPDRDQALAAQNSLNSSITSMTEILESMSNTGEDAANTLAGDLKALTDQMNAIGTTLDNAAEGLGGTVQDISDQDTEADTAGKVEKSVNSGTIQGDWNVGGITGAVTFENDLDPEEDLQISGRTSLNFDLMVRTVIRDCKNTGTLSIRKQNAGGIAGWTTVGLIKNCVNTGDLEGESAELIGGIVGQSAGYIRQCYAKGSITGATLLGGIAGRGTTITDCRSITALQGYTEQAGGIAGAVTDRTAVQNNYYLPIHTDPGGIDRISYAGCAQPLTDTAFYAFDQLPAEFRTVTVEFILDEETVKTLTLTPGTRIPETEIPVLPEREGFMGGWNESRTKLNDAITFDTVFDALYTPLNETLESVGKRTDGSPILLAQGAFNNDERISLVKASSPVLKRFEQLIEAWRFTLPEGKATQLRYLPSEKARGSDLKIQVQDASGAWRTVPYETDGRYLVFGIQEGDQAFSAVKTPTLSGWMLALLILILLGIGAAVFIPLYRKRKKTA